MVNVVGYANTVRFLDLAAFEIMMWVGVNSHHLEFTRKKFVLDPETFK